MLGVLTMTAMALESFVTDVELSGAMTVALMTGLPNICAVGALEPMADAVLLGYRIWTAIGLALGLAVAVATDVANGVVFMMVEVVTESFAGVVTLVKHGSVSALGGLARRSRGEFWRMVWVVGEEVVS